MNLRFSEDQVIKLIVQASDGLSYAHFEGFVHMDIKPQNLFITEEGYLKFGDFGVSVDPWTVEMIYGP